MYNKPSRLLPLLLVFMNLSCGMFKSRQLPEKRPPHLVIETYIGGGMAPESNQYYFSEDSCYAKFWRNRATNIIHFKMDAAKFDALYKVFYEKRFDEIRTRQMETYDRGGINISLHFGDKNVSVSDAGSTYLVDAYVENFSAVVAAIENTVAPVVKENEAPLVVKFDNSLYTDSTSFYFNLENFYVNSDSGKTESRSFQLLRGVHNFSLSIQPKRQPAFSRRTIATVDDVVSVCGQLDTLYISLQDTNKVILRKNIECTANDH
jgi:hypothetical protein